MRDSQLPNPEQKAGTLQEWLRRYANYGIGMVAGSRFPDGTKLAVLDVDQYQYVRVAQALLSVNRR